MGPLPLSACLLNYKMYPPPFKCAHCLFPYMVENTLEVLMDALSVLGDSFKSCLKLLVKVLKHCVETNLVLNLEKSHFIV